MIVLGTQVALIPTKALPQTYELKKIAIYCLRGSDAWCWINKKTFII